MKFAESDPNKDQLVLRDTFEIYVEPSDCVSSTMTSLLQHRLDTSLDHLRIIFAGKLLVGPEQNPESTFSDYYISKESSLHVLAVRGRFGDEAGASSGPFGACCELDD